MSRNARELTGESYLVLALRAARTFARSKSQGSSPFSGHAASQSPREKARPAIDCRTPFESCFSREQWLDKEARCGALEAERPAFYLESRKPLQTSQRFAGHTEPSPGPAVATARAPRGGGRRGEPATARETAGASSSSGIRTGSKRRSWMAGLLASPQAGPWSTSPPS